MRARLGPPPHRASKKMQNIRYMGQELLNRMYKVGVSDDDETVLQLMCSCIHCGSDDEATAALRIMNELWKRKYAVRIHTGEIVHDPESCRTCNPFAEIPIDVIDDRICGRCGCRAQFALPFCSGAFVCLDCRKESS